jgi:hypothetical protein
MIDRRMQTDKSAAGRGEVADLQIGVFASQGIKQREDHHFISQMWD